jgi:type I restriction enzyme S subunit
VNALPAGWMRAAVGELAELADGPFGSNLKTSHYTETGPRVVRLQNIGEGVFLDERAHIAREHYERLAKHALRPGDVVAASLGDEAPRACLVPSWLGPAVVKADCIRVRTLNGVDPAFLMWMLNSSPVRAQAASSIKGVGRPRLGLGGLKRLIVPVPPQSEQQRIVAEIEEHFSRLDAADRSLVQARRRVATLRTSTLATAAASYEPVELESLVTGLRYGTSTKCSYDADGAPVLRIPNVQGGRVDLSDLKFAIDADVDLSPFALESGDLLFVRTNGSRDLIGRVARVDGAEGMAFASYPFGRGRTGLA